MPEFRGVLAQVNALESAYPWAVRLQRLNLQGAKMTGVSRIRGPSAGAKVGKKIPLVRRDSRSVTRHDEVLVS